MGVFVILLPIIILLLNKLEVEFEVFGVKIKLLSKFRQYYKDEKKESPSSTDDDSNNS